MAGTIIVVGSINMDLVVRAPRHPQPGETILGTGFATFPGGKGANQAVAAARLGGQVKMIGRVGSDSFGDTMTASLQGDGVDTSHVLRTDGAPTGVALITVNEEGQNNIVVVPGANGMLTPQDIRAASAVFKGAAVLLLQLEIPLETVAEAVKIARANKVQVILNPAPAQPLKHSLLTQVDYLMPNENELALLTGMQSASLASSQLNALGLNCLVVTLGSQGVLVLEGDVKRSLRPHTIHVVDTTAAGDAFAGAFAVARTEGFSTLEAAEWGNAAGALAVTAAGAQPSLPTRASLEEFMVAHPATYGEGE
jgi:ribokinase